MVHLLCGGLEGNLHDLTITKAKEEQKKSISKYRLHLPVIQPVQTKGKIVQNEF